MMVELKTVNKDLKNEQKKRRRLVIKTQARVRERGLGAWALRRLAQLALTDSRTPTEIKLGFALMPPPMFPDPP